MGSGVMLYFSGAMFVHDFEKRIGNSVKPGGYLSGEGPQPNPKISVRTAKSGKRWASLFSVSNIERARRIGVNLVSVAFSFEKPAHKVVAEPRPDVPIVLGLISSVSH